MRACNAAARLLLRSQQARKGEGIAAGVLESLGATMQRVRAQTLLILDRISKDTPPDQGNGEAPPA